MEPHPNRRNLIPGGCTTGGRSMHIQDLVNITRKFHTDWLKKGEDAEAGMRCVYFSWSGYKCAIGCLLSEIELSNKLIRDCMGYVATLVKTYAHAENKDETGLLQELSTNGELLKQCIVLQKLHDTSMTIREYLERLQTWEAIIFPIINFNVGATDEN